MSDSGQQDVKDAALLAIQESMAEGLSKHGPTKWRTETEDEHLIKAARHILTHMAIRNGVSPDDGGNHLASAVTRVCMALSNRKRGGQHGPRNWANTITNQETAANVNMKEYTPVGTPCG